ncbi:hypothetical protein [Stenotrophomonas sp. 364]|uniref:hypothetical protein n=1 Tax=Stenotrophomonas sp. 364 TaxID=2691571 RepID=UPI001317F19E|nr:hypothetical protein [Stenotrophomonas sp. 364]QHB70881.1 hypothetical protein GQ674_05950 [Stenotrophomonas sp. 364]
MSPLPEVRSILDREEGAGAEVHKAVLHTPLSRLTIWSLALSILGLLSLVGLAAAAFAVEWESISERLVVSVLVILLSQLIVFFTGMLLATISLFRRRQFWRSATLALAVNILGLAAMFFVGYAIVAAMAALAVGAAQAALGGLMVLLLMIFAK